MSSQNETNFFDRKTVLAVLLVGILFFGWQKYLENKYPDFYKKPVATTNEKKNESSENQNAATAIDKSKENASPQNETAKNQVVVSSSLKEPSFQEKQLALTSSALNYSISSEGLGLKNVILNGYKDRKGNPVGFAANGLPGLFEIRLIGQDKPIHFDLEETAKNNWSAKSTFGSMQIIDAIQFDENRQIFTHQLKILNAPTGFQGFQLRQSEEKLHHASSFFNPATEHQEFVVKHQGKVEHIAFSKEGESQTHNYEIVNFLAIGSQYFTSLILDQSPISPKAELLSPGTGEAVAVLNYNLPSIQSEMNFSWIAYVGPKSIDQLKSIDPELAEVINLGFFSVIGKILLAVLKWFYSFVGNWGFSIILLTLLVRALVMPFNIASYKSMKKMQKIQPLLQSVRERYKNDPTSLNRETMAIMRDQKVNPLGGCLPMLLQMPIFFALYQALGHSIELYQAPFIFWIHDLSIKDPFYILPVLMGITMFIQQKITPSTMDPQQAKILQWMPVIFSVFTLSLPAGLTLYIFVSTLFGVLQQQLFMHDRSNSTQTQKT